MNNDSIICVHTYNRLSYTKRTLNSIFDNTVVKYKIVVVDDVSSDGTIPYLQDLEKKGKIKLVLKKTRTGRQHSFALKRYYAYKSGCKYAIMLDNDCTVVKGWLGEMIQAYETLKKNWTGKRPISIMTGFNRGEKVHTGAKYKFEGKKYAWSNWIGGLGWIMSMDVLEVGGWDELEPTKNFPPRWTSPWLDDGSFRNRLFNRGLSHALVYMKNPSLIDHIGAHGVHCHPSSCFPRGTNAAGIGA